MSRRSTRLIKAALTALHYSRLDELLTPYTSGIGVVFALHHVTPEPQRAFEPNRILKVTPDFLETVVTSVRAAGFEIVDLDEVGRRMREGWQDRPPFAAFTFDDGYRDNRDHAYPVLKKHGVPFTIYVPSDFADGRGQLWWLVLERAIERLAQIVVPIGGREQRLASASIAEKHATFHKVYWWLRAIPEAEARGHVADLARRAGLDDHAPCAELVMGWDELRALARDPLVTIGAHTRGHFALAKLSEADARQQMGASVAIIERQLDRPCRHFSYPYGCEHSAGPREFRMAAELGLTTAVTTRKGLLGGGESVHALPRLSLNGDYQDVRYLKALLSGVPFALWNALSRGPAPAQAA